MGASHGEGMGRAVALPVTSDTACGRIDLYFEAVRATQGENRNQGSSQNGAAERDEIDSEFLPERLGEGYRAGKDSRRPGRIDAMATWNVEGISIDDPDKLLQLILHIHLA